MGLTAAIVLNVISHVYRSGNTEVFELGRVPRSEHFHPTRADKEVYVYHNIVILRFNGPIFFGNADKFKNK
jgi:MFS superfamily sulfate permease-like transporter